MFWKNDSTTGHAAVHCRRQVIYFKFNKTPYIFLKSVTNRSNYKK